MVTKKNVATALTVFALSDLTGCAIQPPPPPPLPQGMGSSVITSDPAKGVLSRTVLCEASTNFPAMVEISNQASALGADIRSLITINGANYNATTFTNAPGDRPTQSNGSFYKYANGVVQAKDSTNTWYGDGDAQFATSAYNQWSKTCSNATHHYPTGAIVQPDGSQRVNGELYGMRFETSQYGMQAYDRETGTSINARFASVYEHDMARATFDLTRPNGEVTRIVMLPNGDAAYDDRPENVKTLAGMQRPAFRQVAANSHDGKIVQKTQQAISLALNALRQSLYMPLVLPEKQPTKPSRLDCSIFNPVCLILGPKPPS